MRVIGSPDPYGKHTDGMGGATSSTSKCVIIAKAVARPRRRLSVRTGRIDSAFVDWSGNCGNLSLGGRAVRDCQWNDRFRAGATRRHLHGADLAGQHRKDHRCACAGDGWRGAGNRRFRAGRRDLPGRGNRAGVHRSRRRWRRRVCSRPAIWSTTSKCPASAPQGDDDQRRHPDHFRQCGRHRLQRQRTAGRRSTTTRSGWRCSKRSAHTARCAWD